MHYKMLKWINYLCCIYVYAVPTAPSKPEGERVGSNGILLSWRMPLDNSIHSFVIRYKEMCPYPDPTFTEVTKSLDIPETLLNTLTPGATYNIKVHAWGFTHLCCLFDSKNERETQKIPNVLCTHIFAHSIDSQILYEQNIKLPRVCA